MPRDKNRRKTRSNLLWRTGVAVVALAAAFGVVILPSSATAAETGVIRLNNYSERPLGSAELRTDFSNDVTFPLAGGRASVFDRSGFSYNADSYSGLGQLTIDIVLTASGGGAVAWSGAYENDEKAEDPIRTTSTTIRFVSRSTYQSTSGGFWPNGHSTTVTGSFTYRPGMSLTHEQWGTVRLNGRFHSIKSTDSHPLVRRTS